jgi:hypothetical protein
MPAKDDIETTQLEMGHLSIDMVPVENWENNVRAILSQAQWQRLSRQRAERLGQRCEVCKRIQPPLHLHERWGYCEDTKKQVLVGLISLCGDCHGVVHFGLSELRGQALAALDHLCVVNGWTKREALSHLAESIGTWERRSKERWSLDVSFLDTLSELKAGTVPNPQP